MLLCPPVFNRSIHIPIPVKFSERYLGQLPVITDRRKGCPEYLICCYTFLFGPELQLLSSLQTPGAPIWWEHLPRHVPARCNSLSCTAPALSLHSPYAPVNGAKRGKSAYTETLKKGLTPRTGKGCGNPHKAVAFVAFSPYPGDRQHSLGNASTYSVKNQ